MEKPLKNFYQAMEKSTPPPCQLILRVEGQITWVVIP